MQLNLATVVLLTATAVMGAEAMKKGTPPPPPTGQPKAKVPKATANPDAGAPTGVAPPRKINFKPTGGHDLNPDQLEARKNGLKKVVEDEAEKKKREQEEKLKKMGLADIDPMLERVRQLQEEADALKLDESSFGGSGWGDSLINDPSPVPAVDEKPVVDAPAFISPIVPTITVVPPSAAPSIPPQLSINKYHSIHTSPKFLIFVLGSPSFKIFFRPGKML